MRLNRKLSVAVATAFTALFVTATIAEAQSRRRVATAGASRPLTVQKRSFLDPGKVVPVGRESTYVQATTRYNRTVDYYSQRSRYGNETLPGRFDIPASGGLFNF